ncbi:unnamed protein product [Nesidiocoris tenuis]|uniref:Uncharacterized protein n=1 Tax=Nesidiocoris tenuis TaxID=355587 RepID=A0A6H5GM17_9HEMI|nr:unnamed protein product [Nesidiocoris tenuis]
MQLGRSRFLCNSTGPSAIITVLINFRIRPHSPNEDVECRVRRYMQFDQLPRSGIGYGNWNEIERRRIPIQKRAPGTKINVRRHPGPMDGRMFAFPLLQDATNCALFEHGRILSAMRNTKTAMCLYDSNSCTIPEQYAMLEIATRQCSSFGVERIKAAISRQTYGRRLENLTGNPWRERKIDLRGKHSGKRLQSAQCDAARRRRDPSDRFLAFKSEPPTGNLLTFARTGKTITDRRHGSVRGTKDPIVKRNELRGRAERHRSAKIDVSGATDPAAGD